MTKISEFDSFFGQAYGERWPTLRAALSLKGPKLALKNPLALNNPEGLEVANGVFEKSGEYINPLEVDYAYYLLDKASAMIPLWFPLKHSVDLLDMCAAPGGKSLGYLFRYQQLLQSIELNELSQLRRERLKKVIENYGLSDLKNLRITPFDGINYGLKRKKSFDFIILDAPCGSESHLLQDSKDLEDWKSKRSKRLSSLQYSLLCSALEASRVGGEILYMTCSISPLENDGVIAKLLEKKSERVSLKEINLSEGEKTSLGWIFLPDRTSMGPLYICHLEVKA